MAEQFGSAAVLQRLLRDIESLLKQPNVGLDLGKSGINTSITLTAVQGVAAYLDGKQRQAIEDLETAAEEIQARLARR